MQTAAIGNKPKPATSSDKMLPVMGAGSGDLCDNDGNRSIKTGLLAVKHLLGERRDVDRGDGGREYHEIERVPPAAGVVGR